MHLNKVVLIGNLVKDPEIRYVGTSQTPVSDLRVAVNRIWKSAKGEKKQETLFIDVAVWARSAELAVQYLKKGRLFGVEGRLAMDEWTGADGRKNQRIRIHADRLIFLPSGEGRQAGSVPTADETPGDVSEETSAAVA